MSFKHVPLPFSIAVLLVACGGSVSKGDGGASSGTSNSGGSSSEAGTSPRGGSLNLGGSVGAAGTTSAGGEPSCSTVACATVDCGEGEVPVLKPGACCPTCQPRSGSCDAVTCEPIEACAEGYELAQPPGACCVGCVPKPSGVPCNEIGCLKPLCPPGYTRGDRLGGCCYDCVPDPLFCRDNADCVLADKPRECCGCPEAITRRQYELEPCWSERDSPRPIPQSCYPQVTCDAACAPCQSIGQDAACIENRCTLWHYGLK